MHFSYINHEVVQNIYIYTGREGRDHEITDGGGGGPGRRHVFLTASRSGALAQKQLLLFCWRETFVQGDGLGATAMMARREVWSGSVLRLGEVTNSHTVAAFFCVYIFKGKAGVKMKLICSTSHMLKLVSKSVFCWDCAAGKPLFNLQPWAINHGQTIYTVYV